MRHSIVIKFIAVFLCAACLMAAFASAAGMFVMSEIGLRSRTLEEAYADSVESTAESLASELAVRYASRELGGMDEDLLNAYYMSYWLQDAFNWDQVSYAILDAQGNVLAESEMSPEYSPQASYSFETAGSYVSILNRMTQDEYEALRNPVTEPAYAPTEPTEGLTVYNAVPAEGCDISYLHVTYLDGRSEDYADGEPLGNLSYYNNDTQLIFRFYNSDTADILLDSFYPDLPVQMRFGTPDGEIVLEISDPYCVLEEHSENNGNAYFVLRPLEDAVQIPMGSVYDAIAPEGQYVAQCTVTYADGWSESVGGTPDIGWIGYDEDGYAIFRANSLGILEYRTEAVTYISFHDENESLVFEASDTAGVGFFTLENDTLVFRNRDSWVTEPLTPTGTDDIYIYDDVPPQGYPVYGMELWLQGSSTMLRIENPEDYLGTVTHNSAGNICFTARDWQDFVFSKPAQVQYILMTGQDGRLLFEAYEAGSDIGTGDPIGVFAYDDDAKLVFSRITDTAAPVSREADAVPTSLAPAEPETEASAPADAAAVPDAQTDPGAGTETVPDAQTDPDVTEVPEQTLPETVQTAADATAPTEADIAEETVPSTEVTLPAIAQEASEETAQSATSAPEEPVPTDLPHYAEETAVPSSTDPYEIALAEDSLRVFGYYDSNFEQNMIVEYVYEDMPVYTVEIGLSSGALNNQYEWVLLAMLYDLQELLIPILVASLLLFAITAVYLCCSAGRRPGIAEIRAGGLNCISLDLYLAAVIGGVVCCVFGLAEGGNYLMQQDVQTGIFFCILMAYAACLLIVAFCFAFAAQVKTPGLYWWHNSICGRSLKVIAWLWNKFVALCAWLWEKYDTKVEPMLVRLFRALWKLTKFFCIQVKTGFLWLCQVLIRGGDWLGMRLNRFFSMLPLTWQFLLTGFILVFLLYVMMRTYKVGYILLGFGIFFGVLLYAASAFGILLENAKRMRKGDLDSKVDSRLLVGAFRDFAEELNGLADVAVVAAQKQLKSERMKTELITNVSHDIKTPLTSIINYVDLMEKPHSPEEQQAYLEVLSRQSQRLKKLIDDLMEMSKASTGNMAVDITEVNAAEAINQALGEFADKLDKAQLIPVFRQPEQEIRMMADGRLVWRVLSNLLSNAVKYALPGTRLYIDLMELEGKVVLSLKNISRDSLNINADELLERFVRGDTARNTEGSGLGLNIAQSLMELQKGKLELLVDGDLFKVTLIFPGA